MAKKEIALTPEIVQELLVVQNAINTTTIQLQGVQGLFEFKLKNLYNALGLMNKPDTIKREITLNLDKGVIEVEDETAILTPRSSNSSKKTN